MKVMDLDATELHLLSCYRKMNGRGRLRFITTAEAFAISFARLETAEIIDFPRPGRSEGDLVVQRGLAGLANETAVSIVPLVLRQASDG